MKISNELLNKYNVMTLETYEQFFPEIENKEEAIYHEFLDKTDHSPNKIIESLVENLASATLTTFISVFLDFIKQVRVDYKDVLHYRK